eukprot:m.82051 g.82051  ORF g.82051 m.82051 type:complete len:69 (-) comp12667_c0_seq1:282-488(-)
MQLAEEKCCAINATLHVLLVLCKGITDMDMAQNLLDKLWLFFFAGPGCILTSQMEARNVSVHWVRQHG